MDPLSFRTCLPAGCLVPLDLNEASVDALRAGTTPTLTAQASDTRQDVAFTIPLDGFSARLDRIGTLVGN